MVCPACKGPSCAEDLLDLEDDVLDVPQGGRWSVAVRNFALTRARQRAARRAAEKARSVDEAYLAPAKAKAEEVVRLVTQDDRKAIVFCDQAESVPLVVAALEAADVATASFTGAASRAKRDKAIAADWTVLVTTVAAGGVGLNLTASVASRLLRAAARPRRVPPGHRPRPPHRAKKIGRGARRWRWPARTSSSALDLVTKRMNATDDEADQRALKQQRFDGSGGLSAGGARRRRAHGNRAI